MTLALFCAEEEKIVCVHKESEKKVHSLVGYVLPESSNTKFSAIFTIV